MGGGGGQRNREIDLGNNIKQEDLTGKKTDPWNKQTKLKSLFLHVHHLC